MLTLRLTLSNGAAAGTAEHAAALRLFRLMRDQWEQYCKSRLPAGVPGTTIKAELGTVND